MNIRIIKNAHNLKGNVYSGKFILQKEFEPSEFEGINVVRYYIYDAEKNSRTELLAEKKKYDILKIKSLNKQSDSLYFTMISDAIEDMPPEQRNITLYRYDMKTGQSESIYRFTDDISRYDEYKRTRVFVLNEFYILFQDEYIRYNLTETFKGYFEFEQFLYCIRDKQTVRVIDENLRTNGIESIKLIKDNMCVLKTGFNLMKDERHKNLAKNEVSMEKVSFVNLGQLVSDILLMQNNIITDTIAQAYYTETFPYVAVKGKYIVFSRVKLERHEEEIIFYNYETKESRLCINTNIYSETDLAWGYIIGSVPYIRLRTKGKTGFYNLVKNRVDMEFAEYEKVETVVNDMFVVSGRKKKLFGRETATIEVYRYPDRALLYKQKGKYLGCVATDRKSVYILTE